jgi:hypothetical protein
MSVSAAGLIIWLALLLTGWMAGAPLLIGLFASLPFASTAFLTLHSLGGSSPLIYSLFILALLGAIAARRTLLTELGGVFSQFRSAWTVGALAFYVTASAYISPRLFAGDTTAFIPVMGAVRETLLAPVSGNVTQTAYFLLGAFLFIGLCALALRAETPEKLKNGFFAFAIAHALLGWLDLGAKLSGSGDILLPIRTASYALLTDVEQSGFWRIVGGCSEASTFSAYGLAGLAFCFTYWRRAGSWGAGLLALLLFLLLLLSTSSTAYVGCGALGIAALIGIGQAALRNQLKIADIVLIVSGLTVLTALLAVYLYDSDLLAPYIKLIQVMIFEKATSESGMERAYWNMKSLQALADTYGLGIGMGSSRSSSWFVSTLSQLGMIGSFLVGLLLLALVRGMHGLHPAPGDTPLFALCAGARACGLASLMAASIAGGTADPGVLFFASLATVLACRYQATARYRLPPLSPQRAGRAFLDERLA